MSSSEIIENVEWAVCIITSREDEIILQDTIKATYDACIGHQAVIDVVVNGNTELAEKIKKIHELFINKQVLIRFWFIELGDKANVFNQYFHNIWPEADLTFFVDGYAQPELNSLHDMAKVSKQVTEKLLIAAVPTMGKSAKYLREEMLSIGGLHGNLFALTKVALFKIRDLDFYLPLGLYRTDSLIGAALAFKLEPKKYTWDLSSVLAVVPDASWKLPEKKQPIIMQAKGKYKQMIRQAQGKLENKAIKQFLAIDRNEVGNLPRNVNDLIDFWLNRVGKNGCLFIFFRPLVLRAYLAMRLRYIKNNSVFNIEPKRVF